jgi:hypothetical protein
VNYEKRKLNVYNFRKKFKNKKLPRKKVNQRRLDKN